MRDGNGVYSKPAGIDASPDTTIESADWNSFTADVEQDLNTARPIVAGGTGKTTAVAAADALSTQGANIASASTTNLALATGVAVTITGTTTITAFGTVDAGARRYLTFAGALILTHNAASLILPGGANITTAAGDTAELLSLGSGNWRVVRYTRASGKAVVAEVTLNGAETLTNKTLTTPTLTLKQSTGPAPTAEGDIQWDTNDDRIVVGDGASQKTFSDDTKVLLKTGGTMTGKITLDGDPSSNLHAATKQYVDGQDIGIGQTWQSVTRSVATSYQNTTGKPIMVNVRTSGASGAGNLEVSPDNSTWVAVGVIISNASDVRAAEAIVPAGHYYRLTAGAATWVELR